LTGIEPGPSLYLPIIIAIPSAQQADGQRHPSGEINTLASLHSAAARPRDAAVYGRRSRPSRRMLRI